MIKFAVTSDRNASKGHLKAESDIKTMDIGFKATTDAKELIHNYHRIVPDNKQKRMFVIFSTYQSIDVIHQAQKDGFPEFNLIIADEAHRTAGYFGKNSKEGFFTRVHENNYVHSQLRLYQTATPKVYSTAAKNKGLEDSIVIASMDDPKKYGKTFYHLDFGKAVEYGILTDYKVQVLTVNEKYIDKNLQDEISDPENGINISDIGKIIGTWNAMMKRGSFSDRVYGAPMKRAIAFASVIDNQKGSRKNRSRVGSKQITRAFNQVVQDYLGSHSKDSYQIQVRHADGSMNAIEKKERLDWLREDIPDNQARILSNVKFLGEGIDVPNLDAVIFYAAKRSQIDIIQAVGRIMRKYPGKQYGYVILPIVVPLGSDPKKILDNNRTYKAVWQVLNALRSVDERFDAEINKLHLKGYRQGHASNRRINVIGVDSGPSETLNEETYQDQSDDAMSRKQDAIKVHQTSLNLKWEKDANAIYGEIVVL